MEEVIIKTIIYLNISAGIIIKIKKREKYIKLYKRKILISPREYF